MAPATVIDPQIGRQLGVPGGRAAVGHHVGPLPQQGLDEPLGLTVGPRGLGPGFLGLQSHSLAGFSTPMGLVGRSVVAEHPVALDPLAVEPGYRSAQEPNRGRALLVGQDLEVRKAGGVIHGHMDLLYPCRGSSP